MMPKDTNGNTRDENTIARLARSCQEKDKQIVDQDVRIKEQDESIAYLQERWQGQSTTILEQATLIKKLEEAFLKLYINEVVGAGMPRDRAEAHAKECLEKIKQ